MTIQIRELATGENVEAGAATAAAYEPFVRDEWGDYLDRIADLSARVPHATVLVALLDGAIVGSVTLEIGGRIPGGHERPPLRPDEAHVRMLGVRPEAQGRGAGRALMVAVERRALAEGKRVITLHTTEEMVAARRMYAQLGYTRSEDLTFPDGFVLIGYEKRLGKPDQAAG